VAQPWKRRASSPMPWYGAFLWKPIDLQASCCSLRVLLLNVSITRANALTACIFKYGSPTNFQPTVRPSIRFPKES